MTDLQLQIELAKRLPEKLYIINGIHRQFASWSPGGRIPVQDTEWLHVCWLIEQGMTDDDWGPYSIRLNEIACRLHGCGNTRTCGYTIGASWQQRARAILAVKGERT